MAEPLPTPTPSEARAEALLSELPPPAPLSEAAVRRIYRDLAAKTPGPVDAPLWRHTALAAFGLTLLAGSAWAAMIAYRHLSVDRVVPLAEPAPPVPAAFSPAAPFPQPAEPLTATAPIAHVTAKPRPSGHNAPILSPARSPAPAAVMLPPTPASTSTLAAEGEALGLAVRALRQAHNPAGALELLDAYGRDFPRGELIGEASLLRVETLWAAGRPAEALHLVDQLEERLGQGDDRISRAQLERLRDNLVANPVKGGEGKVDK